LTLVATSLGFAVVQLDVSVVNVAIRPIGDALGGGVSALQGIGAHSAFATLVAQLTAMGFGLGLIVPVMTASLMGSVERSRSGIASGTLNTARQTGSVIGVAFFGSLIAGGRLVGGLHVALVIAAGLSLVVAVLGARTRSPQT
jgi:DHA2 family methylenomycin A resistance protein-like MFS transporter